MTLRRSLVGVGIAAGAVALAWLLTSWSIFGQLFNQIEEETLDWRVRSAGRVEADSGEVNPRAAASEIRLIMFDSLATRGWPYEAPYPRGVLAELIDVASSLGARAIGLDVWLENRQTPEQAMIDNNRYGRTGDDMLRDAIERAGNVVLVGPSVGEGGERRYLPPNPYFADVAAAVATADLLTPFETIRDAALTVRSGDRLIAGFATALYAVSRGMDVDSLMAVTAAQGYLDLARLPDRYARRGDEPVQELPILFVGPPSSHEMAPGAFISYPSAEIALLGQFGAVPEEWFRDRILLLGSGFHAEEKFRTPFYDEVTPSGDSYGWTYGVEVHANALENLLRGEHPTYLPVSTTTLLYLLLGLIVASATFWRGAGWGAAAVAMLASGVIVSGWIAFTPENGFVHVPFVGSMLTLGLAYVAAVAYVSVVEGRQARETRRQFKKYLAPAIVDQLASDPGRLKLGGEKRQISIIFTDLAGFTRLSERMEPEKMLSLLNDYLNEMSDVVLDEGGTLDKYIGDAIMAFYGAPLDQPDHAMRACRTAIRMQRLLVELNRRWKGQERPSLEMRIGINTGTPVVGNIGGENKFDYTALGDAVNLAARLEPACKTYGVETMISKATRDAAGEGITTRELEMLAVYGKDEPVAVYELVGLAGEDLGDRAELLRLYEQGLAGYRRRDFELALQYFEAALEIDPSDGPGGIYAERCRKHIETPPPMDWDFVERRLVK